MSALTDHLAAVLVGSVVLLIGLGALQAGRGEAIERTQRHAHRQTLRALQTALEDDIRNAGAGVPPGAVALAQLQPDRLELSRKDGFGDAPVVTVRYLRSPDGSGVRVERSVGGTVHQVYRGLSAFSLAGLDAGGTGTTVLPDVRAVRVRAVMGTAGGRLDARARYERDIAAPNLAP